MATTSESPVVKLTPDEFKGPVEPDWCPGCGDFGVLKSLQTAYSELGLEPHDVITISGIGCSSNLPGYINTYGMHTLHGRAIPFATGAHFANHRLKVICTVGDGDGMGIGGNHFIHAMRRNLDITLIIMDNQIYGLTTGQCSPTSRHGMKTKSTPYGSIEEPFNPIAMAVAGGATYVARAFSGKPKEMAETFKEAIAHKGFSLVDVFSPCVTYNKDNTYAFFKKRVYELSEKGHDPSDWKQAIQEAYVWGDEIPIGKFLERTDLPSLIEQEQAIPADSEPLARRVRNIPDDVGAELVQRLL